MFLSRSTITFLTVLLSLIAPSVYATSADSIAADTLPKNRNIIDRVIDYFARSNQGRSDGKFDVSFLGGPHYSSETKLGIGLVAAGIYSSAPGDSLTPLSNVSLYGDVSTIGFVTVGIRGNQIFPQDRYRLNYDVNFTYFPSRFWGIGYESDIVNANESKYDLLESGLVTEFLINLGKRWFMGPKAQFVYIKGNNPENVYLWQGQDLRTFNYGVGLTLQYDSRDNLTNPHTGYYLCADQIFLPRFLGNDYAFSRTEVTANHYRHLWRGGVLATQLHAQLNYGNVPWGMLATIGGNHTMRGYYKGRFRDKNAMDFTVEIRQHVYHRSGIALWGGIASVFPRFSAIRSDRLLPNAGIGYRWEFKKNMNVRVDVGFGRHSNGFLFGINEAF